MGRLCACGGGPFQCSLPSAGVSICRRCKRLLRQRQDPPFSHLLHVDNGRDHEGVAPGVASSSRTSRRSQSGRCGCPASMAAASSATTAPSRSTPGTRRRKQGQVLSDIAAGAGRGGAHRAAPLRTGGNLTWGRPHRRDAPVKVPSASSFGLRSTRQVPGSGLAGLSPAL
jgi:hypothetical protein